MSKETELFLRDYIKKIGVSGLRRAVMGRRYLSECEPQQISVEDEEYTVHTACRACISNCGCIAHVKNGRVVKLEGDPFDPMSKGKMCAKGLSGINALYHPNRNKYPLVRVGKRGSGRWRRLTWDEALDRVAGMLMEIREKYGAEYVFGSTGEAETRRCGPAHVFAIYSERQTGLNPEAPSAIYPGYLHVT